MCNVYEVAIGTGLAWPFIKETEAFNEQEAVDNVADFLVDSGYTGLFSTYSDLEKEIEEETVEEYAENHNLVCCGNTGIYLEVVDIRKIGEI